MGDGVAGDAAAAPWIVRGRRSRGDAAAATRLFGRDRRASQVPAADAEASAASRAFYKLREAVFRFELPSFKRVVDVGAAPGGWSQFCLRNGAELVVAVDPAALEVEDAKLVHVRTRVEDAREALAKNAP